MSKLIANSFSGIFSFQVLFCLVNEPAFLVSGHYSSQLLLIELQKIDISKTLFLVTGILIMVYQDSVFAQITDTRLLFIHATISFHVNNAYKGTSPIAI